MMIRAVPYTHTTPNNPTVPSQPNPALVVSNTLKNDTLPTGLLVHTYIVPTPHGGNWAVCKNRGWPVGPRYPSSCFRFHRKLHAFGQMIALPWSMYSSWIGSGAREGALLGFPQYGVCFQRDVLGRDWTSCAAVNGASNWFNGWNRQLGERQ